MGVRRTAAPFCFQRGCVIASLSVLASMAQLACGEPPAGGGAAQTGTDPTRNSGGAGATVGAGDGAESGSVGPGATSGPTPGGGVSWISAHYGVWLGAFAIGSAGSGAFFVGVWLGFIVRGSRADVLKFLIQQPPERPIFVPSAIASADNRDRDQELETYIRRLRLWNERMDSYQERMHLGRIAIFCGFGGVVALVFQLADVGKLVPIQAFVLGATWPSVVTRVMSPSAPTEGSGGSGGGLPVGGPGSAGGPSNGGGKLDSVAGDSSASKSTQSAGASTSKSSDLPAPKAY